MDLSPPSSVSHEMAAIAVSDDTSDSKKEKNEEKIATVTVRYLQKVLNKVGVALVILPACTGELSGAKGLKAKSLVAKMAGAMIIENIENIEKAADEMISLAVSE